MSFEGMAGGWELWLLDKGKGRQISFEWVTRKQNRCPLKGWRRLGRCPLKEPREAGTCAT